MIGLEICVDTVAGLLTAVEHGADRIELCAALSEGGLTPSRGMMEVAATTSTPVRAMIRPRGGDFVYDAAELDIMRRDIEHAASCALEGVVFGCTKASGELDEAALGALVDHAHTLALNVTLHRSFDLAPDPLHALKIAAALRIDTILTSGRQGTAMAGVELIAELVRAACNADRQPRIQIMAGGGVTSACVEPLIRRAGISFIHASCRRSHGYTNESGVVSGLDTPAQRETDPMLIAELRRSLDTVIGSS